MDQAEQLEAQARELETEAVQLETEKLLIAATAKLQQARTLRVNADHMRQQYSGQSLPCLWLLASTWVFRSDLRQKSEGTNVEVKLHKVNRLAEIMEQALQQQMRIVQQQTALNTLCFAAMFQKPVSSPSSQATGGHRRDAVLYYEGEEDPELITDMVTGENLEPDLAVAAYIYKLRWPSDLLDMWDMTIHDPGNIILTSCEVKLKLDRQEICLIPQEIGGQITVRVLNPDLLKPYGDEHFVYSGRTSLTWAHIDGRVLQSRTKEMPAKQVCGIHAHFSIRELEKDCRTAKGSVQVPAAAFGSPGCDDSILYRFMEDSMRLFGSGSASAGLPSSYELDSA